MQVNDQEMMAMRERSKRRRTEALASGSHQRVVSCIVELTEAEIDHIIESFGWDKLGRWDNKTDGWTYPEAIILKLRRAQRKAANAIGEARADSATPPHQKGN